MKCCRLLAVFILHCIISFVSADLHRSLNSLIRIRVGQSTMLSELDNYVAQEEQRLQLLKADLENNKRQHAISLNATKDTNAVRTAVHRFKIMKRFQRVWSATMDRMQNNITEEFMSKVKQIREIAINYYPTYRDFEALRDSLSRLQIVYDLSISDLANGIINGVKYGQTMRSSDCFEVGLAAQTSGKYEEALEWFDEAFRRHSEYDFLKIDRVLMLEQIIYICWKLELTEKEKMYVDILAEIQPHNYYVPNPVPLVRTPILLYDDNRKDIPLDPLLINNPHPFLYDQAKEDYLSEVCRGAIEQSTKELSKCHCKYVNHNNPFLLIGPFKVEEINLEPYIVIFHDVLSDDEMEYVKQSGSKNFSSSLVLKELSDTHSSYRISETGWLEDDYDARVESLTRRAADMTNLDTYNSEPFQVLNYGPGGQYQQHYDFLGANYKSEGGDRLATLLYYLNDVTLGGYTAFPLIKLAVKPQKGTAVFWFNLKKSGFGDELSAHAACPVLVGTKWVINKWFHVKNNHKKYPCDLKDDTTFPTLYKLYNKY